MARNFGRPYTVSPRPRPRSMTNPGPWTPKTSDESPIAVTMINRRGVCYSLRSSHKVQDRCMTLFVKRCRTPAATKRLPRTRSAGVGQALTPGDDGAGRRAKSTDMKICAPSPQQFARPNKGPPSWALDRIYAPQTARNTLTQFSPKTFFVSLTLYPRSRSRLVKLGSSLGVPIPSGKWCGGGG